PADGRATCAPAGGARCGAGARRAAGRDRRARRAVPGPPLAWRNPGGRGTGPLLLAVESSCDETGIAVVEGGRRIHANVVASQVALHAPTGGVGAAAAAPGPPPWIPAG